MHGRTCFTENSIIMNSEEAISLSTNMPFSWLNSFPRQFLPHHAMNSESTIVVSCVPPDFIAGQENALPQHFLVEANRYHRGIDYRRAIVGKLLLRQLLVHCFGYPWNVLQQVEKTRLGCPILLHGQHYLSISHAGELVACAVSNAPVGIDIEALPVEDFENCFQVFGAAIGESMKNSERPSEAFLNYWTRAESVLKAKGVGLTRDLSALQFVGSRTLIDNEEWHTHRVETGREDHICHVASRSLSVIHHYKLHLFGNPLC